ncbi:MAG: hypothetical protein HAW66_05110 [Shewanella sp.]|nr:hypothetical protein [Shewanella sp.]
MNGAIEFWGDVGFISGRISYLPVSNESVESNTFLFTSIGIGIGIAQLGINLFLDD